MKIVSKKPIYNDDVERVVNVHTAQCRAKTAKLAHKLLVTIVVMLAALLVNLLLWLLNVMPGIPSIMLAELAGCVACFAGGRLWEICSR